MRSAVNPALLGRSRVPDNRGNIGALASIAGNVRQGLDKRRSASLQEELLATASVATAEQPTLEDRQAQLAQGQIDLAEEQQLAQTQQVAQQKRDEVQRATTWKSIISDPELSKGFLELQQLDPNAAKTVAGILVSRDEQQIAGLQQQAVDANRFNHNLGLVAIDDSVSDKDLRSLIQGRAQQLMEQGAPYEQLAPLMNMSREEIVSHSRQQMLLSGQVHQLAEKSKPLTLDQIADNQLEREKFEFSKQIKQQEFGLKQKELSQKLAKEKNPPAPDFKEVQSLRKEFASETKSFVDVNDAYTRVIQSAKDPSPAGDMALIFNYMKILDPGSTVREGEFATAKDAGSVPQSIIARYNSAINGQMLEQKQRDDFVNRAGRLFEGAAKNNEKREKEYTRLAELRGINPEEVIINRDLSESEDSQSDAIDQAKAAIAAGAPRQAVLQRLQESGISVEGL